MRRRILGNRRGNQVVQTFIEIAQLTNPVHISAVQQLETDLKAANLWDKMAAVYPFVGGNAHAHKFNLIDPRDADNAFRLKWDITLNGNLQIHSETGMNPNSYGAETFLAPSILPQNSAHLSYYSRTNNVAVQIDIGGSNQTTSFSLSTGWITSQLSRLNDNTATNLGDSTPTNHFGIVTRTASNYSAYYRNGVLYNSKITASLTPTTQTLAIGSKQYSSTRESGFASIGLGLTPTEASDLDTIVQNYNTALGRAIPR